MLVYIRNNVRTSFDKLWEDAIGYMFEPQFADSVENRFHSLLCDANYKLTDLENRYEEFQSIKANCLETLENQYSYLPT